MPASTISRVRPSCAAVAISASRRGPFKIAKGHCSDTARHGAAQPRASCQLPHQIRNRSRRPAVGCRSVRNWGEQGLSGEDLPQPWSVEGVLGVLYAFYKFTRPHTMIGTTISITSVSLLALQGHTPTPAVATAILQALSAALMANISIVGLNQVFDVDIDRVNKPDLPLASGEFSLATGVAIVLLTAAASLALSAASGSPALLWTVAVSLVLGILYSTELPFMRWKRFPVLAMTCILAVRAVIVQLGFYFHVKHALGTAQITLTRPLTFTMGFMLLFSVVIALFKDIPDVKGDDQAGVRTFSVRHGVPKVFWTCVGLLLAAYAGGVAFGLTSTNALSAAVTSGGHLAAAALLWTTSQRVNLKKKKEIVDHYMFIWKLFYAEYLLIPFFS